MNNLNPIHSFVENKKNKPFSEFHKTYLLYGKYSVLSEHNNGCSQPGGRLRTSKGTAR